MDKQEEEAVTPAPINIPLKTLYEWGSPSRTFQKYDKEVFSTMLAVAILFSIVLVFVKEFLLIVVIWALAFFFYALSKRPPEEVTHKITTRGITSMEHDYKWDELGSFWFVNSGAERVLKIYTQGSIFGELVILIGNADEEKIRGLLEKYLPYLDTPIKNWSDNASDWLVRKFSFDKSH